MLKFYRAKRSISIFMVLTMILSFIPGSFVSAETTEITGTQTILESDATGIVADVFENQPGGNSVWRVTGDFAGLDSWDPANSKTVMSHIVGEYYAYSMVLEAGYYEFKFTRNGGWDGCLGNNGSNFSMSLSEKTKVNFYLNDEMQGNDKLRTNIGTLGGVGINQYVPVLSQEQWPRLVGDLQTAIGDGDGIVWNPGAAKQMFVDYYFNNSVYKLQRTINKGSYECKAVFGNNWDAPNYGSPEGNLKLGMTDDSANVTFSIDCFASSKFLVHDYKPKDLIYDGMIDRTGLYFDSQSTVYKKPFGAIRQGAEDATFRIAANVNDAQSVKLELINGSGISKAYNMAVVAVLDNKDYWEVTVPKSEFTEIGVWGYKFILIDGATKAEYGDDGVSGSTGAASAEGQTPYNLTVYDAGYQTPDWMKNAVVYQIFPDRFYDGDSTNNSAKNVDGVRGDDVQLFDGTAWSTLPENPRQLTEANKPYYPDATTDWVWCNEFYGGDIEGIQQKLGYLQTLGVTAIYLNPVSWAASNHKYDATDYRHLDPMFGEPVYNTPGDPASGLNYAATKQASDAVYQNFSDVCDDLGIDLISDGVFNHVGDDSIYFDRYRKYPEIGAYEFWSNVYDKAGDGASADRLAAAEAEVRAEFKAQINPSTGTNYTDEDFCYINWFTIGQNKVAGTDGNTHYAYEGWWGYDSLPVIATETEGITNLSNDSNASIAGAHEYNNDTYREEVIGYDLAGLTDEAAGAAMQDVNSQRWLWMGSSGWRLDVAPDVSYETWKQFRRSVKSAAGRIDANGNTIDEPVILGEEWGVATHYLLGDTFDSVMNYQFRAAIQNFIVNNGDAANLDNALEIIRENYPEEAWQAMLNLVDSHDTIRNITKIDNPSWEEENTRIAPEASARAIKLQALTAIFQMSYPGAPTIYYGDEVGVTGTKDPDSRRTFPWERVAQAADGTYTVSAEYDAAYGDLFDAYAKAAEVRNGNKDLFATGDLKTAYAKGDVIAYARKSATKGGMSIINKSDAAVDITADVTDFLPDGIVLRDQLGSNMEATVTQGRLVMTVPAYTGMMMVSTTDLTALPSAPANLTATAIEGATGAVELSWNTVEGADGYLVYRTMLEGMEGELLTTEAVVTNTYTDTAVKNGTRYYYYVKTVDGGIASVNSNTATALPSYKIQSVSKPTALDPIDIGVGVKTGPTTVNIRIDGLTDNAEYANKTVPGLKFTLAYYKAGSDRSTAKETELYYSADTVDGKSYTASFEPTEEGTYYYFAKASVNNGYTYTESEEATMAATLTKVLPEPVAPVLKAPNQESNRVTLGWSVSSKDNIAGFDVYRTETNAVNPVEIRIATLGTESLSEIQENGGTVYSAGYTDYTVSNDMQYSYRVDAFNADYARAASNTISIMPQLTMVDVTLRLHIPANVLPSATDNIYAACDANGWNASGWQLKKPSGATDSNIVEYTFKMMTGKKIQYKYTRGTWETEALASNIENDITSPGNYGYSSTETNMSLTVNNQGDNKMLVDDYVLRWVDMPMMITVPRISYKGETIEYSTEEASFNLQASVPFGGIFTVNGVDINTMKAGALNEYGIVRLDNIPLKKGVNEFILHTEPTEETKAMTWLTDTGRIGSQMTATTVIRITKTSDDVADPVTDPATDPATDPTTDPATDLTADPVEKFWDWVESAFGMNSSNVVKQLKKVLGNLPQEFSWFIWK